MPGKTNDKLFGDHFGPFKQKLGKFRQKWMFLEKRALSVFKYSNYLPSCKKAKKNYWKKNVELMGRGWQTDRQTDNSDFIEPSVGRGSNKINWEILLKPPTESGTNKLWKLNIPLYGLCGGPHSWYLNLKSVLLKTVATRSTTAVDPWHL